MNKLDAANEKIHTIIGKFVMEMSKAEFALDRFLWAASAEHSDILETFKWKGNKFINRAPISLEGKIHLAKHFLSKIRDLSTINDKNGEVDVGKLFCDFDSIRDFRNKIIHGSVDIIYWKDGKASLRAHKYPLGKPPYKLDPYWIEVDQITDVMKDLPYFKAFFHEAYSKIQI